MNSLDITPEETLNWESKKLWNTLNTMKNEENTDIKKEEIEKIKNGINIEFPIWYLTEEWYEIYPNSKKVIVRGFGKYPLLEFMKEKEERESEMRNIIIRNIEKNDIIEGRV